MRSKFCLAAALLIFSFARAEEDTDRKLFWDAHNQLTDSLQTQDIATLANEAAGKAPASASDALRKIVLLKRAGRIDEAMKAIDDAAQLTPPIPTAAMNELSDWLIRHERHLEYRMARRIFERFPRCFTGVAYASYTHWKDDGATDQQIEAWLADRAKASDEWKGAYHQYLADHDRLNVALDPLLKRFKDDPTVDNAIDYLAVAKLKNVDPSAVLSTVKVRLQSEMLDLANATNSPFWRAKFLESALITPRTPEDDKRVRRHDDQPQQKADAGPDDHERRLRQQIVSAFTEAERPDLAKPHVEALAKMPGSHATDVNAPAAAGSPTMLNRIAEDEKTRGNDPDYWLQRAGLAVAKGDHTSADAAFARAFDVAEVDRPRRGKDGTTFRSQVLVQWVHSLPMPGDGYEFAWTKLQPYPKNSGIVRNTLLSFAGIFYDTRSPRGHILASDERLWSVLAETAKWEYSEEMIVRAMLDNADASQQRAITDRILKLADGADLSRVKIASFCIGAFAEKTDAKARDERVLPLIERLYREAPDRSDRVSAASRLLEIRLREGKWQLAEALLPVANEQSDLRSRLSRIGDVAECAARTGARDDAMRLWKQIANQDRLEFRNLRGLARNGLGTELSRFYDEIARLEPTSIAPRMAREELSR